MWKLATEEGNKREYTNPLTGGKCSQSMVYTDKEGNKWWQFTDLTSMPYTRNFAANKISSLYALGLSKDDLSTHINGLKEILKSDDKFKYEKAFANVLEFESKATNATDAIKQMSSLVCVYFTINDEAVDSFDNQLQLRKMGILESDPEAHSFFLSLQVDAMSNYTASLNSLLQIASQPMGGQ